MLRVHPLSRLIAECAENGLLFGTGSPLQQAEGSETEAVAAYLSKPALPKEVTFDGLTPATVALAIVAGARRVSANAQAVELAAAQLARDHGATVRQLANAAGINERSAFERYRRDSGRRPEHAADKESASQTSITEGLTCPQCHQPKATEYRAPQFPGADIVDTVCLTCGRVGTRLINTYTDE
jgi:hypothetical protein